MESLFALFVWNLLNKWWEDDQEAFPVPDEGVCRGFLTGVLLMVLLCISQEGLALPSAALPGSDPSDLGTPGITVF